MSNPNWQHSTSQTHQAVPPVAPQRHQPQEMAPGQIQFLQRQGFSGGLIGALWQRRSSFPVRIWILDNSQYMNVRDAHVLRGNYQNLGATRWEELQDCIAYHAQLATTFMLPTRFALVNPTPSGPQYFSLAQSGNIQQDYQTLQHVMRQTKPAGPTPLTKQLRTVRDYVQMIAPQLRAQHQIVPIILATQGLPTNEQGISSPVILQEFIQTLTSLESLPVWLVIRLCTDDERAFEFYNSLDAQHNQPCDILDDFYGEAVEVYLRNPWLCYALPLHRFREMGFQEPVLDTVDERALNPREVKDLCQFLFGFAIPVDPLADWNGFLRMVADLMSKEQNQFNPISKSVTPWLNLAHLNAFYGPRSPIPPSPAAFSAPAPSIHQRPPPPQPQTQAPPEAPVTRTMPASVSGPIRDATQLKQVISTLWAMQPPQYTSTKPVNELLATVDSTFPFVEPHEYFQRKFHPFSKDALASREEAVLKRAVRKMKFFLHPDKLPKDFDSQQTLLCRSLWDTMAEAWERHNAATGTS